MALFLQWWWSYPETEIMDRAFFTSLDPSKELLYIPTAMVGGFSYEECYEYVTGIIKALWLSIEVAMYPSLKDLEQSDFNQYGWIYIWWWNTFKLLSEMRNHWIDRKVIDFLQSGGNICGGSAWAIIFWENINTAPDANIVWLHNVQWFRMTRNTSIRCHYQEKKEQQIQEYISHHHVDVIALSETTGLIIQNNLIKTVGEWKVIYYSSTSKKIYGMNELIA